MSRAIDAWLPKSVLLLREYNFKKFTADLSTADIIVWLLTLTLTVVADLTLAVEVGMILAAFSFIRKISMTTMVSKVTNDYIEDGRAHILQDKDIPEYAAVYRIHAPFLFGVTDKIAEVTKKSRRCRRF
jgi:sulfate permease, SulP family